MAPAAHGGRHRRKQNGVGEGSAAALEHFHREAAVRSAERDAQRSGRGFGSGFRGPEQEGGSPPSFGGDLQAPELRVLRPREPREHRAAGVRRQRLLGRPQCFPVRSRAHNDERGDVDAGGGDCRRVGQVGRGDPGEPRPSPGRKRGPEQAQLADALVRGENLGQRPGGPAATGKRGVKLYKSARDDARASPVQAVAAPDIGTIEESRERHAHHGS